MSRRPGRLRRATAGVGGRLLLKGSDNRHDRFDVARHDEHAGSLHR
jgi:hypothetical protein